MRRPLLLTAAVAVLTSVAMVTPLESAAASPRVSVSSPASAQRGLATAITITLPADVAAVDGRLLFSGSSVEVVGVAPVGGGTVMRPVPFKGGASFGAYDLHPSGGKVRLGLVVVPQATGRLNVRVVIDAAATRAGRRLDLGTDAVTGFRVGRSTRVAAVPGAVSRLDPKAAATVPQELVPDGKFTARDLDTARLEWTDARDRRAVCRPSDGDANGDGCTDIVDVQAMLARLGERTDVDPARPRAGGTGQRPDARRGAHLHRAQHRGHPGRPPGGRPVRGRPGSLHAASRHLRGRQPAGRRPHRVRPRPGPRRSPSSSAAACPSSRPAWAPWRSTATPSRARRSTPPSTASTAIPGVELVGNGNGAREAALRITSGGNTIRGLAIRDVWRAIILDGEGATGNRIVGNWVGLTRDRRAAEHDRALRHPDEHGRARQPRRLAGPRRPQPDRRTRSPASTCTGPARTATSSGTTCCASRPDGAAAPCHIGRRPQLRAQEQRRRRRRPAERNVIGPTQLQGVELSHGWDPTLPWGTDTATT